MYYEVSRGSIYFDLGIRITNHCGMNMQCTKAIIHNENTC